MRILKLNKVSLTYFSDKEETQALKDISFEINEGEFVSIVGPSGCGKTTILSIISGLIPATNGIIELADKNGSSFVGYMFQKDNLMDWRTVLGNVYLGLEIKGQKTEENIKYVNSLLKKYGLWDFKDKYPRELSGGMRQRVALIRTLALRPTILLLDEAFSALDYQTRLDVCDDVYKIIKSENLTTILVTHDISEAISLSDKIIILSHRPATVKQVLKIEMPKEDNTPFKRRESVKAKEYFDNIWRELK